MTNEESEYNRWARYIGLLLLGAFSSGILSIVAIILDSNLLAMGFLFATLWCLLGMEEAKPKALEARDKWYRSTNDK